MARSSARPALPRTLGISPGRTAKNEPRTAWPFQPAAVSARRKSFAGGLGRVPFLRDSCPHGPKTGWPGPCNGAGMSRQRLFGDLLVLLLLTVAGSGCQRTSREALTLAGSTSLQPLAEKWADA